MVATEAPNRYEEDCSPGECLATLAEASVNVSLQQVVRWSAEQRKKAIEWADLKAMAYPFAPIPPPPGFLSRSAARDSHPP